MEHVCNDRVRCEKDPGYGAFGCFAAGDIHNVHESDDGTRLLGYTLPPNEDGTTRKELVMYPFNWQEEGYEDEGWYEYELRDGKVFTFNDWAEEQDREWREKKASFLALLGK